MGDSSVIKKASEYASLSIKTLSTDPARRKSFQEWVENSYNKYNKEKYHKKYKNLKEDLEKINQLNIELKKLFNAFETKLMQNNTLSVLLKKKDPEKTKAVILKQLEGEDLTKGHEIVPSIIKKAFSSRENLRETKKNFDQLKGLYNVFKDRIFYTYPDAHLIASAVKQFKKLMWPMTSEEHDKAASAAMNDLLILIAKNEDPYNGTGLTGDEIRFLRSLSPDQRTQSLKRLLAYKASPTKSQEDQEDQEQKNQFDRPRSASTAILSKPKKIERQQSVMLPPKKKEKDKEVTSKLSPASMPQLPMNKNKKPMIDTDISKIIIEENNLLNGLSFEEEVQAQPQEPAPANSQKYTNWKQWLLLACIGAIIVSAVLYFLPIIYLEKIMLTPKIASIICQVSFITAGAIICGFMIEKIIKTMSEIQKTNSAKSPEEEIPGSFSTQFSSQVYCVFSPLNNAYQNNSFRGQNESTNDVQKIEPEKKPRMRFYI